MKRKESLALIKVPNSIKDCIIKFSSSFNTRQVDNYYSLVQQQSETQLICQICLESVTPEETLNMPNCKDKYCKECLHNYLIYKIKVGEDIACPSSACPEILSISDPWCQQLPKWAKDRYQKTKIQNQNLATTSKAICSEYNCKGKVDFDQDNPKCDSCKVQYCRECRLKSHGSAKCDEAYSLNFNLWRRCPGCRIFMEKTQDGNKMVCKCGIAFCAICDAGWSDVHLQCQQQIDPLLENVYNKQSIIECCRCYNVFKSFFMILLFPFLLILGLITMVIFFFLCAIGGFLFSPCYARSQGYATWATIVLCPCIGIYSIGNSISSIFCEMVKSSCDSLSKYCNTIKALCSYSHAKSKKEGTAIQF